MIKPVLNNYFLYLLAFFSASAFQVCAAELMYRQADQLVVQTPKQEIVITNKTTFKVFLQNTMNRVVPDVTLIAQSKAFGISIAPEKISLPKEHRTYFDVTLSVRPYLNPGQQQIHFKLLAARQLVQEFSVSVRVEPLPEVEDTIPPAQPRPAPSDGHNQAASTPSASPPEDQSSPDNQVSLPQKPEQQIFDETNLIIARPIPESPQIDGNLDEPTWETAAAITGFTTATSKPPEFETAGRLLYDQTGMFLNFSCVDEDISLLTDKDTIEITLTRMFNARPSFCLVMSPTGHVQLKRTLANGREAPWIASGIQFATEKTKRAWTLEVAIPFATMGMRAPTMPERWFFRVVRAKSSGKQETSFWAPNLPEGQPGPTGFGAIFLMPANMPKPEPESAPQQAGAPKSPSDPS